MALSEDKLRNLAAELCLSLELRQFAKAAAQSFELSSKFAGDLAKKSQQIESRRQEPESLSFSPQCANEAAKNNQVDGEQAVSQEQLEVQTIDCIAGELRAAGSAFDAYASIASFVDSQVSSEGAIRPSAGRRLSNRLLALRSTKDCGMRRQGTSEKAAKEKKKAEKRRREKLLCAG